jgi:nicotinamide-nucleotide amidase
MNEASIPGDEDLAGLVKDLAHALLDRGWHLVTAESCTGGWIAKCCTDRAGSSRWFERGLVSYSNDAKMDLLGVESDLLVTDGAVSEAVVRQMAEGARHRSHANAALAVTGIAGPDGGERDKPVGTVWFAWAVEGKDSEVERMLFEGDREAIRRQTVAHALGGMRDRL